MYAKNKNISKNTSSSTQQVKKVQHRTEIIKNIHVLDFEREQKSTINTHLYIQRASNLAATAILLLSCTPDRCVCTRVACVMFSKRVGAVRKPNALCTLEQDRSASVPTKLGHLHPVLPAVDV